ncbi:unnamed protein product [Agarophyton chilense]
MNGRLATGIADHTDYLITRIVRKVMESALFTGSLLRLHMETPYRPPGVAELSAPRREYHQENPMVGQSRSRRETSRLNERQISHQKNPGEEQARSRREAPRLEERPLAPPDRLYEVQRPQDCIGSDREIDSLGPYSAGKKRSNRRRKKKRSSKRRDHSDTSDSESASTETTDSEVDEADVRGLRQLTTTNELFLKILDYRNYRLADRSAKYSGSVARRVAKWAKRMQLTITDNFSGSDPIAVLKFLSLFRTACDKNGVHEGATLYLFQFFRTGQVLGRVVSKISGTTDLVDAQDRELLRFYPQVVHYLLETYATDDVVVDAHQEAISIRPIFNMTKSAFADDLWKKAYRCGNWLSE